jgi:choline trimethylamine-lyase activating enzyme
LNVKIRMPLIRGMNDSTETIHRTMKFLQPFNKYKNFQGIDLLPYHKLGINKYKQLDIKYAISEDLSFKPEELERIAAAIKDFDLQVKIIKH